MRDTPDELRAVGGISPFMGLFFGEKIRNSDLISKTHNNRGMTY